MIIHDLEQGSEAWKEWRKEGITASDIPIIMGLSPYMNIDQLFLQKIGEMPPQEENFAMRKGKEVEVIIRDRVFETTGLRYHPITVSHKDHPWAKASLDGYLNLPFKQIGTELPNVQMEAKYNNKDTHELARQKKLRPDHMAQLQWQLFCTGALSSRYDSYNSGIEDMLYVEVFANKTLQQEFFKKAQWFYNCVVTRTPPSDPISDDLIGLMEKYEQKYMMMKLLNEELDELKGIIRDITPREKSISWGRSCAAWRCRTGSIDYKSIKELGDVDLSKYKKPDTEYFEIRVR